MLSAALFTITKTWKPPKCSLTEERIYKESVCVCVCVCVCVYTMEYYSAIKKDEIMLFATTWMNLEIIILNEVRERKTNMI